MMKKLSGKAICKILQDIDVEHIDSEDFDQTLAYHFSNLGWGERGDDALDKVIKAKLGDYEVLEYGRCMDDPDQVEVVIHFKEHNIHIGMFGYHSSWDGDNWDDATPVVVEPEEVKYTRWNIKK